MSKKTKRQGEAAPTPPAGEPPRLAIAAPSDEPLPRPAPRCERCGAKLATRSSAAVRSPLLEPATGRVFAARRVRYLAPCPVCGWQAPRPDVAPEGEVIGRSPVPPAGGR